MEEENHIAILVHAQQWPKRAQSIPNRDAQVFWVFAWRSIFAPIIISPMMLSKTTIAELQRERRRLQNLRDEAAAKIDAITALINGEATSQDMPLFNRKNPSALGNGHKSLSLAIRSVLTENKKSMRPTEVAQILTNKGITTNRKDPFPSVVNQELYRMAKRGVGGVKRSGKGRYKIVIQNEVGPASSN